MFSSIKVDIVSWYATRSEWHVLLTWAILPISSHQTDRSELSKSYLTLRALFSSLVSNTTCVVVFRTVCKWKTKCIRPKCCYCLTGVLAGRQAGFDYTFISTNTLIRDYFLKVQEHGDRLDQMYLKCIVVCNTIGYSNSGLPQIVLHNCSHQCTVDFFANATEYPLVERI